MDEKTSTDQKIGSFFDDQSRTMSDRHEHRGLPQSMKWQIKAVVEEEVEVVLDVGSGPGTFLIEVVQQGVKKGTGVDLSDQMNQVATQRLVELELDERVTLHHGNFLDLTMDNSTPDAISLHRVLCCYPDRKGMLNKSVDYQPRIITLSVLRDWKILRLLVGMYGLVARLTGSFRPYVHSQESIDQQMHELGYQVKDRQKGWWWVTTTYGRGDQL